VSETLRELISRGPVDASTALSILEQLLRSLEFAHWRGLTYACITPEGIVLFSEPRGIRAQFGITPADVDATAVPGGPVPSALAVEYAAPEQIAGAAADEQSDVFALAVVVYEMLTGSHPFGASEDLSEDAVKQRILHAPPLEMPGTVRAALPEHVAPALRVALAKDPGDRFPSALRFLEAVQAGTVITGEGTVTTGEAATVEARTAAAAREPAAVTGVDATAATEDAAATTEETAAASPPPPEPAARAESHHGTLRDRFRGRKMLLCTALGVVAVIALVAGLALLLNQTSGGSETSVAGSTIGSTTSVIPATTTTTTVPPTTSTTFELRTTTAGVTAATLARYEESDPRLAYSGDWSTITDDAASGTSLFQAADPLASVTVTFEGTYLAWIARRSPVYGMAEVTLDGQNLGTIDLYDAGAGMGRQQKVWGSGTLEPGVHTVTISCTGEKNPAATDTIVGIDAFDVVGALIARRPRS